MELEIFPVQSDTDHVENLRAFYQREMKIICGDDKVRMPFGYLQGSNIQNDRMWDYYMILKYGGLMVDDNVLEVGAMNTFFAIFLSRRVNKITATDSFQWATREHAKDFITPKDWQAYLMSKADNLVAEDADIQSLPYPDNSFDAIVSVSVHEHVFDDKKGLAEIVRVLRPGGRLIMTTEYNEKHAMPYSTAAFLRIYDRKGISELMSSSNLHIARAIAMHPPERVRERKPFAMTTLFISAIKPMLGPGS